MRKFLLLLAFASSALFGQQEETIYSQTTHETTLNDASCAYTATVGSIPLRKKEGEKIGELFYTYYRLEEKTPSSRPVTFAFNGGPGSSSIWLHLGAFGPKRVLQFEEGQSLCPPYRMIDNPDSILDLTDLVFIDPIGTGFSRTSGEEDGSSFFSMNRDIAAFGDFIRDFLTREGRWNCAKYLAGESYGTLRACGLSEYLISKHGIYLNGVILISCAIDYKTLLFERDNELPFSLYLPSYAATAWYHGRLQGLTLEEAISQSRDFALDVFAPTLFRKGSVPSSLYPEIAAWTGLPLSFVQEQEGLIDDFTYFVSFGASDRKVLGRFDSRRTGDILPVERFANYEDPSGASIEGIFTASFQNYLRDHLQCKIDWPRYEIFSVEGLMRWDFDSFGYPNQLDALRKTLVQNPSMQIFTACGYFDLATPFAAAEYCFKRLRLPREENVTFGYYEGGHMFYTNPTALNKFKNDLRQFYQK